MRRDITNADRYNRSQALFRASCVQPPLAETARKDYCGAHPGARMVATNPGRRGFLTEGAHIPPTAGPARLIFDHSLLGLRGVNHCSQ
jgi:hypothetical protein